ncbi:NAD(P)/FAD-dependent oxidoreductase [Salinicoccus halitifaciens]|uniref:Thioredoxin reductase n=1 Tax=Salinicoccus halitifaciens TaxID=1073415 RepID=A0ABV2E7X1_9STAP|nr:NAD(P)/FAD-dependent oxidoreductase [Salinicoccus halitifaciens]MCD2136434.1 NAD(P)/FAD-dependent oxidoreductase [Salinicoccus halitifaciens]
MYDVIVIGGGPAGLSAALNFGRGLKETLVIDAGEPRNRVAEVSNGFLTQDDINPYEFREKARKDVLKYDNVSLTEDRVTDIDKDGEDFIITTESDEFKSRQVLLATGLKEETPDIENFDEFYGTSAFYCPWCDGYELKGKRIAVMADEDSTSNLVMLLANWSQDLILCTGGKSLLNDEDKIMLKDKGFDYSESPVSRMVGSDGMLEKLEFEDGTTEAVEGMFAKMKWDTDFDFLETLNPDREDDGGLRTNPVGETSVKGLFTAGETKTGVSSQLINAAASGADVAKSMMIGLMKEEF